MLKSRLIVLLVMLCSALSTPVIAGKEAAEENKAVWGFYLGYPRALFAQIPAGPDGEPDPMAPPTQAALAAPRVTTYLIGTTVPEAPIGPPRFIPSPQGGKAWLPPHQLVMNKLVTAGQPHYAEGVFVLPGDKATAQTVKTDQMMDNAIVSRPLATHIKIGTLWLPLTSHLTIRYGLEKGLLALQPFMGGHLQWTGPVDGAEEDPLAEILREATTGGI